jgi:hypothetical protein
VDAEEYNARLDWLIGNLMGLYGLIGKLFDQMPIPIAIAIPSDEDTDPDGLIESLLRARDMLGDLPVGHELRALLSMAVVEWLGAYDMCALTEAEVEVEASIEYINAHAYRLEVIWLAEGRIMILCEKAREYLPPAP